MSTWFDALPWNVIDASCLVLFQHRVPQINFSMLRQDRENGVYHARCQFVDTMQENKDPAQCRQLDYDVPKMKSEIKVHGYFDAASETLVPSAV